MVLRPILRTIQRKILRPLIAAAQRVFITLDAAQEGHYLLENPVVETGDFSYSFEFNTSASVDQMVFSGGTGATGLEVFVNQNGAVSLGYGGTFLGTLVGFDARDSKLHAATLTRVGTTVTIVIDESHTRNWTVSGDTLITVLGRRAGSSLFFDGVIANVDLGNGNAWKLDRGLGNTEQAANGNNLLTYVNIPTGAPDRELFTLNTTTTPNQWENADKSRIIQVA